MCPAEIGARYQLLAPPPPRNHDHQHGGDDAHDAHDADDENNEDVADDEDKDGVEEGGVIINNQDTDGDDEVCNAYDEKDE